MTALLIILGVLAALTLAAAVIVTIARKVPILDALKIVGLGVLLGGLAVAAVAIIIWRRSKDAVTGDSVDALDSGSAAIGGAFDETRDQLRSRIKAILQQAGSR
jgi:hypothetical protein